MGAQESVFKSVIAVMIPAYKRGRAFGLFNTVFGVCWFLGSVAMGYLYDVSLLALVLFSLIAQAIAFLLLTGFFRWSTKGADLEAFSE
jgi:hypothetical protein